MGKSALVARKEHGIAPAFYRAGASVLYATYRAVLCGGDLGRAGERVVARGEAAVEVCDVPGCALYSAAGESALARSGCVVLVVDGSRPESIPSGARWAVAVRSRGRPGDGAEPRVLLAVNKVCVCHCAPPSPPFRSGTR